MSTVSEKQIIEDFFEGLNLSLYSELQPMYDKFRSEIDSAGCGRCAMKKARRKYSQLINDLLKAKGVI